MTGKYALIVAAVLAAAGIVWFATRSGPTNPARGSAGPEVPASGDPSRPNDRIDPIDPIVPRSLPAHAPVIVIPDANDQSVAAPPVAAVEDAEPAPSLDETFNAEARDTTWAPGREREFRDRLAALPPSAVTIAPPECRAQQCRITITAHDDAAIGTLVGMLEEPTGLQGWAEMMVLEAVTTLPSGERRARIYARFARPAPDSPK